MILLHPKMQGFSAEFSVPGSTFTQHDENATRLCMAQLVLQYFINMQSDCKGHNLEKA